MKLTTAVVSLGLMLSAGCSAEQLSQYAAEHPSKQVAATTQAIERMSQQVDRIAEKTQAVAAGVQSAAQATSDAGVPFAQMIAWGAALVGAAAAGWIRARKQGQINTIVAAHVAEAPVGISPGLAAAARIAGVSVVEPAGAGGGP